MSYNEPLGHMVGIGGASSGDSSVKCLMVANSTRVTFFVVVDSGAGQCLCSVGTAFSYLQPCRIEVTGVSGSLPIYGCGTANFVALDHRGNQLVEDSELSLREMRVQLTERLAIQPGSWQSGGVGPGLPHDGVDFVFRSLT